MNRLICYIIFILFTHGCVREPVLISNDTANESDSFDYREEASHPDSINEVSCQHDNECQNELVCDGQEKCMAGQCTSGSPLVCDDEDDCTIDFCDEDEGGCVFVIRDEDDDGFGDEACGGSDCDDHDDAVNPGAEEIECDGRDNNCDGLLSPVEDADSDGYVNADCATEGQEVDCDDMDDSVYPGAPESCEEGEDLDCSGTPDVDDDGDNHLDGRCPGGDDCDDNDPRIYPGAPEICLDGLDQDCDGLIDGPEPMMTDEQILGPTSSNVTISLSWTGSEYGMVFGPMEYIRVSVDGVKIGEEMRIIDDEDAYPNNPSMAWTGSEFAIAYNDRSGGPYTFDIYFLRTSPEGILIDAEVQLTNVESIGSIGVLKPSLAWTGSFLGLAWDQRIDSDSDQIFFKSFSLFGEELSEAVMLSSEEGEKPQIAWTGSEFGVAWITHGVEGVSFTRVGADGVELGEESLVSDREAFSISNLVWSGSEYGIAWSHGLDTFNSDIYFARIGADGSNASGDIRLTEVESAAKNPALAWTGDGFAVAWNDSRNDTHGPLDLELFFSYLTPTGEKVVEEFTLGWGCWGSRIPIDMAWTESEFGIVWIWDYNDSWLQNGIHFNRIGFCD